MPFGPHLQHRRVVIGGHLAAGPGPQRRDRHRQGIVRIVLIRVTSLQQPHPAGQLRLHVQHPLARRDQLLGQQPTAGALHRPGPLRPQPPPTRRQLLGLDRRRPLTGSSPSGSSAALTQPPPPCASPCAGSTPIITAAISTLQVVHREGRTWRACRIPDLLGLAPLSSRSPRRDPTSWDLVLKPDRTRSARRYREPAPSRILTNATAQPQRPQTQLGGYLDARPRLRAAPDGRTSGRRGHVAVTADSSAVAGLVRKAAASKGIRARRTAETLSR